MRGLKIAILAQPNDRVPSDGSLALWATEVASSLSRRHDVTIYSRQFGDAPSEEVRDGVRHVRVTTRFDNRLQGRIWQLESRLGGRVDLFFRLYYFGGLYAPAYTLAAAREIRKREEGIVFVVNFSQFLPRLRRLCPRTRLALVMQCDWLVELPERAVRRRLRSADLVLGCSRYIAEGIRRRFPEFAGKVESLYNGSSAATLSRVDPGERIAPRDSRAAGEPVVLFVGRATPEKGVHVLIEAMKRVHATVPKAVLYIIGGFAINPPSPLIYRRGEFKEKEFESMKADYESYVRQLAAPLGDRIRFVSEVPHGQLAQWYDAANVFVHPAVWNEPFGMVLTEAMAFGCPIVSTHSGGVPEIVVHGETGLLVAREDEAALGRAISELLLDEKRASRMGAAGRERLLSCFTWDRTGDTLEQCLASRGVIGRESFPER